MADHEDPLFQEVDCIQFPVPDLEAALTFYRDALGHKLVWRTATAAGLALADDGAEIVLQTERAWPEVDLRVKALEAALIRLTEAGASLVAGPIEIPVGRVAVVRDPWNNELVLIELNARYLVDTDGNVVGVGQQDDGH